MKTTTCYVIQARTETFTNVNWKLLLPIETVLSALMRDVLLFTASLTSPLRRCIKKSCECLRDKQTNSSAEQCKFSAQKKKLRWLGTEKKSEVICARAKYFALRRACVPKRKGKEKQRAARAVAVVLPLMKLTSPRSTLPAFSLLASLISLDDRLLAQVLSFLSLAVFLRNSPRKVFTHSRCQFHNHIRLQEDPKKKNLELIDAEIDCLLFISCMCPHYARRTFPCLLFLLIFFSLYALLPFACARWTNMQIKTFILITWSVSSLTFLPFMSPGNFLTLPAIFRAVVFVDGFLCILDARKKVSGFLAEAFFWAVNTHENWLAFLRKSIWVCCPNSGNCFRCLFSAYI